MSSLSSGSGWNTSADFYKTNYDPTSLMSGLQSAATYDPTQQSTTMPTSAAHYLGATTSNNASTNTATTSGATSTTPLSSLTLQNKTAQPSTAASYGLTSSGNNTPYSSYASKLSVSQGSGNAAAGLSANQMAPSASTTASTATTAVPNVPAAAPTVTPVSSTGTYTVAPQGSAATSAPGANAQPIAQNTQQHINSLTQYSGPQVIGVPGANGTTAYYRWNPTAGAYQYAQTYSSDGGVYGGYTKGGLFGNRNPYGGSTTLTSAELSGAQIVPFGANLDPTAATQMAGQVTKQMSAYIDPWNQNNQQAYQKEQSAAATSSGTTLQQQAEDYMTTHGGQLPPNMAAILGNTFSGNDTTDLAQQQALQQAVSDYQTQMANTSAISGIQINPIDTSAVDASNTASMNSLISQYASQGGGANAGLASRGAAFQAAALGGQNVLNHDTAAATSYDSNLSNFTNAMSTQMAADTQQTGNQLYSNIQSIQQITQELEQEMSQLSTHDQQIAQAHIQNLQGLIQNYQNAVSAFGQGSSQAIGWARTIMSTGATVAGALV